MRPHLKRAAHRAARDKPEAIRLQAIDHLAGDNPEGLGLEDGEVADLGKGGGNLRQVRGGQRHVVGETRLFE